MFKTKLLLLFATVFLSGNDVYGQGGDFCEAVTTIMRDAPNRFKNIRGNMTVSNFDAATWTSGITVPGTVSSRFVYYQGMYFEGALLQTKQRGDLRAVYDEYTARLDSCILGMGYKKMLTDNFYEGLGAFKKVVYMPAKVGDRTNTPPHLALEAMYSKEVGKYTLVMFIYQH